MEKGNDILSEQEIILHCVSESQKIPVSIITGRSRKEEIIYARHAYCYISNTLLRIERANKPNSLSYAKIAGLINKDHATVIHAHTEIQNRIDTEKVIRFKMQELINKCRQKLYKDITECELITDFSFI